MKDDAKISVVLPCYNAEKYIRDAMESILKQTYKNIELIVINDGSTDGSLAVIQAIANSDSRVVVISRENRGLIASLNEGISMATGAYIARMDADDISMPHRLQAQMEFMHKNNLDLVGGAISRFYSAEDRKERPKYYPETHDELVASILTLKSRIAHPAVLAKKTVFDHHHYDARFKHAEDYALWLEIILDGKCRVGNYSGIVLKYRSHPSQVHTLNRLAQKQMKRFAFVTLMAPVMGGDVAQLEKVCDFWQGSSLLKRFGGFFYVHAWLNALDKQPLFNSNIKKYIIKRMVWQLF